jgi:uncharacterized membrane protein YphA (DoxX/SURF4 family)
MATTTFDNTITPTTRPAAAVRTDASEQAFRLLHLGFIVAPIVAGADKFTNLLTDWTQYLPAIVTDTLGIEAATFMMIVGVIEIAAGILVAVKPKIGGLVVAAWLLCIIIALLMVPGYYDVALRDLGLLLGALALSRLAAGRE